MEKIAYNTPRAVANNIRLCKYFTKTLHPRFRGRALLHPAPVRMRYLVHQNDVADLADFVTRLAPRGVNFTKLTEIVKETSTERPHFAEPFFDRQAMGLYDILIIEEDEMSRLLMGMVLKRNFLTHKFAHTPQEAADKYAHDRFRLLVVGVDDPDIGQKGLQDLLKRNRTPVVAMSANLPSPHIPASLMRLGFREMLAKPYSENSLMQLIHNHMIKDPVNDERASEGAGADKFNLEQLNRIGSNDRDFLIKMLEKFVISASECSEALGAAAPARDWKALKAAAHKSIPSYSLMGLHAMMRDLEYIDQHANTPEHQDAVIERAASVEARNKQVIGDVNAHIAKLKEETTTH